ncbi:hypothetical protein OUZ56_030774 [Daphnia magna]|uniref:Uncharacterized protein n=1 Tax=Daphnia magna TaxID=35525 RepID=A0ABQ9ZS93_9CRUS|nr:hypothetical protein OUZ56_030774 [Daphnia magna]
MSTPVDSNPEAVIPDDLVLHFHYNPNSSSVIRLVQANWVSHSYQRSYNIPWCENIKETCSAVCCSSAYVRTTIQQRNGMHRRPHVDLLVGPV